MTEEKKVEEQVVEEQTNGEQPKRKFRVFIRSVIAHNEEFFADDMEAAKLYAQSLADNLPYDQYKKRDAYPTVAVTELMHIPSAEELEQQKNAN